MDKAALKFAKDGDGSLLIWTPPLDLVADSQPVESLAIPYQPRLGGALYAVPSVFLDENVLIEMMTNEEDGIIGPYHEFYSDLIEEAEDTSVIQLGRKAPIILIDLADEALQQMRDYDPVTDSTSFCCPFSAEKPQAIVSLKDIGEAVKEWAEGIAAGRPNFYSAREEPSVPKAAPKRQQQKKVTTAALADQVASLVAQMQLLSAQQQEIKVNLDGGVVDTAIPAAAVSGGQAMSKSPFVAPWKGWNPKDYVGGSWSSTENQRASDGGGCPRCHRRERALRSLGCLQPRPCNSHGCNGTQSAEHRHNSIGGTPHFGGSSVGARFRRRRFRRALCKGSRKAGEDAVRPCIRIFELLFGSAPTDLQEDVPCGSGAKDRGRGCGIRGHDVWVPGEAWEFPRSEGPGLDYVDPGPRFRLCQPGRLQHMQGVSGFDGGKFGSSSPRWKLEHSLPHQPFGGAAIADDVGKERATVFAGKAFCRNGSTTVECCGPSVLARDGAVADQEGGVKSWKASKEGGSCAFSSEEAKVPEKAEGLRRGRCREVDDSAAGGALPPYVHHDQHSVNSFLSAGGSQPKNHPRSYGPDKMNFCKDVCKDKGT